MLKSSIRLSSSTPAISLHRSAGEPVSSVSTRFGEWVDVRRRGALRLARLVGVQVPQPAAPAVVRLWSGDSCRELSTGAARALAARLLEAADHADAQNRGER